jgi:hypothetical protein
MKLGMVTVGDATTIHDACPSLPIGRVFGAMLLASGGASQVRRNLAIVPGAALYRTAMVTD